MNEFKWSVDEAMERLDKKNLQEALPNCPNCDSPSRLKVVQIPKPPFEETVLECSVSCWHEDPGDYLRAVAVAGAVSQVDPPTPVVFEDIAAEVETIPELKP